MKKSLAVCVTLCAGALMLIAQDARTDRVGPMPGGRVMLNTGWTLDPAGKQIPVSTFPMSAAVAPGGKHLVVLQAGLKKPSLAVFALPAMTQVSTYDLDDAWLGLQFAPGSSGLFYVSGASRSCVYELQLTAEGRIEPRRTFPLVKQEERKPTDFAGDVSMSPDGRLIYVAALYRDSIWVINPQSGRVIELWKSAHRPYRILFHPDGKSFFVTGWGDGSLYRHDTLSGALISRTPLGAAPMDMAWREGAAGEGDEATADPYKRRLYIALANTNSVVVLGDTGEGPLRTVERINVGLSAVSPAGMTPSALALTRDGKRLYVVCSDANAVAVVDVSAPHAQTLGFIPAGAYPTAARSMDDGSLIVLNGRGSVSLTEPVTQERLAEWTRKVLRNSPYSQQKLDSAGIPAGSVIPNVPGDPSPIKHVIYIVKDALSSDLVRDESVTPNHRALAREFVSLDHFHANGDVAADGVNWSIAAIAPPYVQRLWPGAYAGRRNQHDFEGGERAAFPPAGYLWNNALSAGLTLRNYGWWCDNINPLPSAGMQISAVRDPSLKPHTSMTFRAPDPDYLDTERAQVFIAELKEYEKTTAFPTLVMLRLGGAPPEHAPGKRSAKARAADTDLALGMIVDAVSKSKYWPQTAIFVIDSNSASNAQRMDSHQSQTFIASPYTRRRGTDSTMYTTTSVLRTIELIVGLRPMTIHDAGARPMYAAFSMKPDPEPYDHAPAKHPLDEAK